MSQQQQLIVYIPQLCQTLISNEEVYIPPKYIYIYIYITKNLKSEYESGFFKFSGEIIQSSWWTTSLVHYSTKKLPLV